MIITIGGDIGSGKTTLATELVNALGYEELYVGRILRKMAIERNMSITDFYEELEHYPELEKSVDAEQAKLMREKDNLIVQGRIAWFFAKGSPFKVFNIYLAVDPRVAAERSTKHIENIGRNVDDILKANERRMQIELARYQKLYGIENFKDPKYYDLVLDTTQLTEAQKLEKVLEKIKSVSAGTAKPGA